ncbi:phage tail terminator-like protein [Azorhizobium doebereinerae]|uniref:phage tail terminator-like protein n=1 Tax=Azorhizobium doebereinerae TaxID=281091 RepID=UPI00048BC266|nr:phage tail terminator-like protein [Azorhizobium doebereinerae]
MASGAVKAAVRARLADNWTRCEVFYPNGPEAEVPTGGTEFLSVQFPVSSEKQITVGTPGDNVFREEGGIRFVLSIPRDAGTEEYDPWMDELAALFRGKQFGVVTTYAPSSAVLDDRNADGAYFKLAIAVPYYADLFA